MSSSDEGPLATAVAAAPSLGDTEDTERVPSPPLCSGEAGREFEGNVLEGLVNVHCNHYYVLPAAALKDELLSKLVFTDAPLSKQDMHKIDEDINALTFSPERVFARGDVIGCEDRKSVV